MKPTREEAFKLLCEYNKGESLINHALQVEKVMGHFCEILDEPDREKWMIIGLIHDLDYEMYPELHCVKSEEILKSRGWPEDYIRAVVSHGYGICSQVVPEHRMEKVLYAIDELTGFIHAVALMRPSKSIMDTELKSIKKKWKQKSFAQGVDRSIIEKGAKMLGFDLDYLISETLAAMKK